ncbi:MAG: hypothetical protein ABEI77_06470 [Halorientalis sp.]
MSVVTAMRQRVTATDLRTQLLRIGFGDRPGLAVFLAGLCFFTLYWRVGVFITDTNAILNTLVNVAHGHLYITQAPYGSGKLAPGTHLVDGKAYGRDYGIVFVAVPVYWAIQGLSTVLDPGVLLVGVWPLSFIALSIVVGNLFDRPRLPLAGGFIAVLIFGINLTVAQPVGQGHYPVLALQIVTMLATALTGVFIYRLVSGIHTQRIGILAAFASFLGTPLSFWAAFPKRHSFTVLLLFVTAYAFYRSRVSDDELFYRALTYVPIGLMAWIHSAEALALFLPLVIIDVATAESNDRRSLGIVAFVFLLSMVPFFLTNAAISGNPLEPPRMLTPYESGSKGLSLHSNSGGVKLFGDGPVGQFLSKFLNITSVFGSLLVDGTIVTVTEPTRLFETLVRSGYIHGVTAKDGAQAINLTVLESAPILGAVVGIPLFVGRRLKTNGLTWLKQYLQTPASAVDLFALGSGLLFFVLYIPRLPLHAQATVRYLHPLYPLGIYGLARLPAIRRAATTEWRMGLWSYLVSVFIGGQILLLADILLDLGFGEAVQLHALVALAGATLLAIWTIATVLSDSVPDNYGAAAMGVTIGATTVFVLLALLYYFNYADVYAVPVFRVIVNRLALV